MDIPHTSHTPQDDSEYWKELEFLGQIYYATKNCFSLIEQADTKEEVEVWISALEEMERMMRSTKLMANASPDPSVPTIRKLILEGFEGFTHIRDKCIRLGVK